MKILKKLQLLLMMLLAVFAFASCSESEGDSEEYADWQNTNEAYFTQLYNTTRSKIASGDTSWKVLRTWSKTADAADFKGAAEDNIVVNVLEEGSGSGCPLYTDSVYVHYSGRLLPSKSYDGGLVFDKSYYGTFDITTAKPAAFKASGLADGFTTALLNMHIGDYWRVYIPYQLGYGASTSSSGSIPAYSTLVFDIRLVGYSRPGAGVVTKW